MITLTNQVILTTGFQAGWTQITGEKAVAILRQQGYTHILIDDDGYIDALNPYGVAVRRYCLFYKTIPEVLR